MCFKDSLFYQKWISPYIWIILNAALIILFYFGINFTLWWATIDTVHVAIQVYLYMFCVYAFTITFVALPLVIIYHVANQELRSGLRFTITICILFLLLIIFYWIASTYFSTAPQYIMDAGKTLMTAIIGGFTALILKAFLKIKDT